jgi:hypothetical protein
MTKTPLSPRTQARNCANSFSGKAAARHGRCLAAFRRPQFRQWITAIPRLTQRGGAGSALSPSQLNQHKRLKSGNQHAGMRFATTSLKPLKNGWMCQ